ncbi:hypothetical protein ROHU_026577 [Labeo rohita]|uniref:Uncharacterized protein n=1 Tax=Labeo rohita TaxID=84645 RepID=A0A498MBV2_LABRO|nr:hypothetical protein ROHU_026577 [Labeo rohita]
MAVKRYECVVVTVISCHVVYIDVQNKGCVLPEAEFWDVWTDLDCNDGHPLVDSCHLQKLDFYDRKTNKRCVLTEAEFWDVWTDIDSNDGHLLMDRIRDVFYQKQSSGSCGQTLTVMMDTPLWTDTLIVHKRDHINTLI